jgi:N-acetylmuramoyl-L-alanine amidase
MMNRGYLFIKVLRRHGKARAATHSGSLRFAAAVVVGSLFILGPAQAQSPDIQKLKAAAQQRINTYLDKEKKLSGYYDISDFGLRVYASPEKKLKMETEFGIEWRNMEQFTYLLSGSNPDFAKDFVDYTKTGHGICVFRSADFTAVKPAKTRPLEYVRIVLDPGHTAGSLASGKTEQKFVHIPKDSLHHIPQDIELVEGHLTLGTALVLKKKLEEAGAIVMMTRNKPEETAFGISFEEWKKTRLNYVLDSLVNCKSMTTERRTFYKTKADNRRIFHEVFRDLELQKRADLINAFHPDLTVIIHYNVDEKNTDWKKLSDKNFVMTFIGGGMLASDLRKSANRFEFLRMAITDDLEKSELLSASIAKSLSDGLHIPIATKNDATYLKDNCLGTSSPGVYCRNLILTRIIHGPLVYGESLYQDNKEECFRLMKEDEQTAGVGTSLRIRQVAEAYYSGILTYLSR